MSELRQSVHPIFGPEEVRAYAWIITHDFVTPAIEGNDVGTAGPRSATEADVIKAKTIGRPFRLLDDDRNVYYHGKVWYSDDATEDHGSPLDDFGTPNAGAVILQYKDEHGEWEDIIS